MEKRRFGRTGHFSTVAIFGGAALGKFDQAADDAAIERVIAAGVNHIDIAPSYSKGMAESRIAPWLASERKRFFLGCKTTERTQAGAAAELLRSLEKMHVDYFDLYQLHAVTTLDELDKATAPGGALEAVIQARAEGLTKFIGITGHGLFAPNVFLEALRRFDFDTVLFPINAKLFSQPDYRRDAEALLRECRARDVGVMAIKAITKGPWSEREKKNTTWYEPFTDAANIQQAVNFALSQDITGLCTAGDVNVLPLFLDACEHFTPLTHAEQETMITNAAQLEPLFV